MEENDLSIDALNARSSGTLMEALGIRYTLATAERVEAVMAVDERTCQPFGILHGGASLALAETLAGLGSMLALGKGGSAVGAQVSANHVGKAMMGDTVKAVATPIHLGYRTHVWNVDIETAEGRPVSTIRVTNCVIM